MITMIMIIINEKESVCGENNMKMCVI
jgi:hypothetical protein